MEVNRLLCKSINPQRYDPDLGAHLLEKIINRNILHPVFELFLEDNELIVPQKSQLSPLQRISVKPTLNSSGQERFEVSQDGLTEMWEKKSRVKED